MLHHKGFKSVLIGLCLVLLTTGGLFTIVGSGGGGDDPDPEGAAHMLNQITCSAGGTSTAVWTFGGQQMVSTNGQWSACARYAPGSYSANLRITVGRCGTYTANFARAVVDACTETLQFRISNNRPAYNITRACPGSCISAKSADAESTESTTEEVVIELTQVEPGDGGYIFIE